MARRSLVKINKFQIIRLDMVKPEKYSLEMLPLPSLSQSGQKRNMSKVEVREQENLVAVGGLRDPRKAVARSSHLRRVGERIRAVMDEHLTDKLCSDFEQELGVCDMAVLQCRNALACEFKVDADCSTVIGYQIKFSGICCGGKGQ